MSQNQPGAPLKVRFLSPEAAELYDNGQALKPSTPHSAGVDLRACLEEESITIQPGQRFAVPSGLAMEIDKAGLAGFIFSRSGLGTKQGLTVSQGVGVIDPDYRGQVIVSLLNTSDEPRIIERGQRIAQLCLLPFFQPVLEVCDELSCSDRGEGGFGSTGK